MERGEIGRLTGGHRGPVAGVVAALVAGFVVAAAVAANGAAAVSGGVPSITEFPIAGSANPDLIAPGLGSDPAASVWVSDPYGGADGNGRVYRIDAATGALSGTFAPPPGVSVPEFIVRGPDARMWVTAADTNGTLMRAAADGAFTDVTPTGGSRAGLTVGPDQNVWYLNASGGAHNGQVGFVDPSTLASQQFDIPTADSHPEEITAGPPSDPNSVWFTEESTDRIGRVDTITHQVTDYGGLTAGARPNGIVVGSDGGLWFAEYGTGKIGRIDPVTDQVTEYGAPGALDGPDRMTVAPDGRIWFTLFNASEIGSFIPGPDPTFDLIPTPTANAAPSGITIGPDGHVWFAEYNNHAVARIDGNYPPPTTTTTTTTATTPTGTTTGPTTTGVTTTTATGSPTLPATDIYAGPPSQTIDHTATFDFTAQIPGGPPIIPPDPIAIAGGTTLPSPYQYVCRLDGGPFNPCVSPYTTPALAVGQHTFDVAAVASTGLDGPAASISWAQIAAPPVTRDSCTTTGGSDTCATAPFTCPDATWVIVCSYTGTLRLADAYAGLTDPDVGWMMLTACTPPVDVSRLTDSEIGQCSYDNGSIDCATQASHSWWQLSCPLVNAAVQNKVKQSSLAPVPCAVHCPPAPGTIIDEVVSPGESLQPVCRTVISAAPPPAADDQTGTCTATFNPESALGELLSPLVTLQGPQAASATTNMTVFSPGPGTLAASAIIVIGGSTLATTARAQTPQITPIAARVRKRGAMQIKLRLNRAATKLLAHRHHLTIRATLAFTPTTGRSLLRRVTGRLAYSPRPKRHRR